MKLYDIFTIDNLVDNVRFHNSIGIHTFALCTTNDHKYFDKILYNVLAYLKGRSAIKSFGCLYAIYSEYLKKKDQIITLPYVRIHYGISLSLYTFINNHNHPVYQAKIIINPSLFVESFNKDFDPERYDYTRIIPRDLEFWNKFRELLNDFLTKWGILNDSKVFSINLSRADSCADIEVPAHFPISKYIGYHHRVLKSFSYNDEIFSSEDQYAHQLTTCNKAQAFTMYEKMHEQKVHHHNYYDDGTHLLRLEYKLFPAKIRDILSKLSEIMVLEIPQQVTSKKSLDTVLDTVQYLVMLSPIVLLYGIKLIFPRGSFYTRKDARRRIKANVHNKNSRKLMCEILRKLSSCEDYSDVVNASNRMKESLTPLRYYRIMNKFRMLGIAPLYLDKEDSDIGLLPCVYDLFLSALIQTEEEYIYIQAILPE